MSGNHKKTGMTPDEVYENFNMPLHDSEMMQANFRRVSKDKEYREKLKKLKKSANIEKCEIELGRKTLKTLVDEL